MLIKEIVVNGTEYRLTLTDQLINQVNNLKSLYNVAYEDPESFEQVSSDISNSINEIAAQAEPPVEGDDLDGFIQELIKAVDEKAEELREEMQEKTPKPKNDAKPNKPAKAKKSKK
jgi:gas vesicle protein